MKDAREAEAAMVIATDTAGAVANRIARLTVIAGHHLVPRGTRRIHDVYFDAPDGALQAQRVALRIREIDGATWVTLKGPSHSTDWGGKERLEIELPWSQDALKRIVAELAGRRFAPPAGNQRFDSSRPVQTMLTLGLHAIQDRQVHRRVRDVVTERPPLVLAELAIDSVTYQFDDRKIHHHEVEIETKSRAGSRAGRAVVEGLLSTYGPALRVWPFGKLATGKTIERLLREDILEGLLDSNDSLTPAAYDRIAARLESGGL
jgi:inorganic triphosphatase YgiF